VSAVASASRARVGLIALLLALAVVAWWSTADRMGGMDDGPGTALGALGWFLGVWVVMMAAMMFPSVAPTVALYAQMARRRAPVAPLLFAAGYLVTWAAVGLVAYALFDAGRSLLGDQLTWGGAGRWIAGGTLIVAAATRSRLSRMSASASAAARWAFSSDRGAMGTRARSRWARDTARGAPGAAGRSWPRSSPSA
jgi:Predicted metal-binding integral membrane protein (DUF2182)